jgi:hypothetical protein
VIADARARFRFYAELNDFLPAAKRQVAFDYDFAGTPSVKDAIEAIGVPHPAVDLIVANGVSVGWDYHLASGDNVSVYPTFEALDISHAIRLRPAPLRVTRFVLDAHLGRLARWLRMLGFDSVYDPRSNRTDVIAIAAGEHRVILTRDRLLLKDKRVTHGYWVRATSPRAQIEEVVARLHLHSQFAPFSRCMECNGTISERAAEEVASRVPPGARERAASFHQCDRCGRIYWEGTHVRHMRRLIDELTHP